MMRKLSLKMLALLAIIGLMLCAGAMAEEVTIVASGECGADGANVTWELDSEGTLTISGEGAMKEFSSYSSVPWYSNRESIQFVVIENGVTSIGTDAFTECSSLTSIIIPDSVSSIGNYAFKGCSSLTSITIPDSVTSIGISAFEGCNSLISITIPDSVISIGSGTFRSCINLISIAIPDSVASIGDEAFYNCNNLEHVYAANIESWMGISFGIIANPMRYASNLYFNGELATHVTIPEGVSSVRNLGFCITLTGITIPDSVTSIGNSAFLGCSSLTSITIPDSVTSIGISAFKDCNNLISITIPDSVSYIGSYAFEECSSLTSIIIPDSVTSIGSSTFKGCSSLTSITIPDSVNFLGEHAFEYCSSLTNVTIPDSVTSIRDFLFYWTSLTSITIPDGVTSIGNSAFSGCSSLTTIVIPDSVTSIGYNPFYYCSNVSKVYLTGDNAPSYSFPFSKSKTTIYCHESSGVASWAARNGYNYVYLNPSVPESLEISGDVELYPEEKLEIQVYTLPESASKYKISWKSSNTKVVTVENGILTALSAGTATITASCGSLSDSVTVTVLPVTTPKLLTLSVDMRMDINASMTVQASTFPLAASEYEIMWESSNPGVATVENGVVTPVSVGTTTITASCDGVSDSMEVTVYADVKSFELSASELWIVSKETAQLTVQNVLPEAATGYTLTWSSSDTSVLTVDGGAITTKIPGDAVIIVTSDNRIARQCIVHVCYPVTAIEFEDPQMALAVGETAQLTANVTTHTETLVNKLVSFASSDESVVTVDENGVVTAVASGSATISATSSNGITAKCAVIVHNSSVFTLPASLTVIEDEAFEGLSVGTVVLPEGTTTIGSRAFADCTELTIVHMPDSVESIADDAFEGCEKVTFLCASENAAAEYAKTHGISCRVAQ